jgi:hypothetical protein
MYTGVAVKAVGIEGLFVSFTAPDLFASKLARAITASRFVITGSCVTNDLIFVKK